MRFACCAIRGSLPACGTSVPAGSFHCCREEAECYVRRMARPRSPRPGPVPRIANSGSPPRPTAGLEESTRQRPVVQCAGGSFEAVSDRSRARASPLRAGAADPGAGTDHWLTGAAIESCPGRIAGGGPTWASSQWAPLDARPAGAGHFRRPGEQGLDGGGASRPTPQDRSRQGFGRQCLGPDFLGIGAGPARQESPLHGE